MHRSIVQKGMPPTTPLKRRQSRRKTSHFSTVVNCTALAQHAPWQGAEIVHLSVVDECCENIDRRAARKTRIAVIACHVPQRIDSQCGAILPLDRSQIMHDPVVQKGMKYASACLGRPNDEAIVVNACGPARIAA